MEEVCKRGLLHAARFWCVSDFFGLFPLSLVLLMRARMRVMKSCACFFVSAVEDATPYNCWSVILHVASDFSASTTPRATSSSHNLSSIVVCLGAMASVAVGAGRSVGLSDISCLCSLSSMSCVKRSERAATRSVASICARFSAILIAEFRLPLMFGSVSEADPRPSAIFTPRTAVHEFAQKCNGGTAYILGQMRQRCLFGFEYGHEIEQDTDLL